MGETVPDEEEETETETIEETTDEVETETLEELSEEITTEEELLTEVALDDIDIF